MGIDQASFVLNEGAGVLNKGVASGKITASTRESAMEALSTAKSNLRSVGVDNAPFVPVVITYTDPATHKKHEFAGIKHAGDQTPVELFNPLGDGELIHFEKSGANKGKPTKESAEYLAGLAAGKPPARAAEPVDTVNMLPSGAYVQQKMNGAFERQTKQAPHLQKAKQVADAIRGLPMNDVASAPANAPHTPAGAAKNTTLTV